MRRVLVGMTTAKRPLEPKALFPISTTEVGINTLFKEVAPYSVSMDVTEL